MTYTPMTPPLTPSTRSARHLYAVPTEDAPRSRPAYAAMLEDIACLSSSLPAKTVKRLKKEVSLAPASTL